MTTHWFSDVPSVFVFRKFLINLKKTTFRCSLKSVIKNKSTDNVENRRVNLTIGNRSHDTIYIFFFLPFLQYDLFVCVCVFV